MVYVCKSVWSKTISRSDDVDIAYVELFKESIIKLNVVQNENELMRVIEVISLDDYEKV